MVTPTSTQTSSLGISLIGTSTCSQYSTSATSATTSHSSQCTAMTRDDRPRQDEHGPDGEQLEHIGAGLVHLSDHRQQNAGQHRCRDQQHLAEHAIETDQQRAANARSPAPLRSPQTSRCRRGRSSCRRRRTPRPPGTGRRPAPAARAFPILPRRLRRARRRPRRHSRAPRQARRSAVPAPRSDRSQNRRISRIVSLDAAARSVAGRARRRPGPDRSGPDWRSAPCSLRR